MTNNIQNSELISNIKSKVVTDFPDYCEHWNEMVLKCKGWGSWGIAYLPSTNPDGSKTDVLLYRNQNLELLGVLQYFPVDIPILRINKGNINLFINPKYFKKRIGSLLLQEAMIRWNIDLSNQLYTLSGYKFISSFLRNTELS